LKGVENAARQIAEEEYLRGYLSKVGYEGIIGKAPSTEPRSRLGRKELGTIQRPIKKDRGRVDEQLEQKRYGKEEKGCVTCQKRVSQNS
jgi:hypothetical protein